MSRNHVGLDGATRRQFLATTGAAVLAAGLPSVRRSVAAGAPATFRRMNLADPANARNVAIFQRGVTAMLALPPTDPRNWYRHALIHLLDCPHMNWWFLPWHRGYIGWLEAIVRQLTGQPTFALPYWDWTTLQRLPDSFINGNLNPANFPIPGFAQFKAKFEQPFQAFWNGLTTDQSNQLAIRGYTDPGSVWASIENAGSRPGAPSIFSDIGTVRQLNPPNPSNFGPQASSAVDISTIHDALVPTEFVEFGSSKVGSHHQTGTEKVLEAQPHDMVHGEVGGGDGATFLGFMSAFLSPVDPIFFMHHANLDRLWDVWSRKQAAQGQPTTPTGADLDAWTGERFLFFVGPDGTAATRTTSGDYVALSSFDYDYQPGSGEDVVPTGRRAVVGRSFAAAMESTDANIARPSVAAAQLPNDTVQAVARADGPRVVAEITVVFPPDSAGTQLHVLVNVPAGKRFVGFKDPHYAGTYRPFALHHHAGMAHRPRTVTFTIGLTNSLRKLAAAKLLRPGDPIKVSIVPDVPGVGLDAGLKVTAVKLKTYQAETP